MKTYITKYRKHILYFFISMAVFALLNIPSEKNFFQIGNTNLRISAVFPVTAGLLTGPAGALGCAAGNLISDSFGNFSAESIFGCLANFLYAWLPYRCWHTLLPVEKHKLKFVSSANTMLKFIVISFFSTAAAMAVLSAGCELIKGHSFLEIFFPTLMCNLFFSLFGGTMLFLVLTKIFKIMPYVPQKLYIHRYYHKRYIIDYILCACCTLLIIAKTIYSFSMTSSSVFTSDALTVYLQGNAGTVTAVLDICIIATVLVLSFLPMLRSRETDESGFALPSAEKDLQTHMILVFFIFTAICSFILFGIFEYIFVTNDIYFTQIDDLYHITLSVIFYINLIGIIFILLLYIVLKTTENTVTKPIINISNYCESFVQNGLEAKLPDLCKTSTEISKLASSCEKMSSDIVRYISDIQQQAKREENARVTLEAAAKIQMSILPKPLISDKFYLISYIRPAQAVGGDFYDFAELDDNRLLVCIADVSSKGLPAAIFMAVTSTLVKCNKTLPANEILKNVNIALCENNSENMFVTIFIGVIDSGKNTFEFSNAGHNFPIVFNGGKTEFLKSQPQLPLGFFPDTEYSLHTIKIEEDFELLLYTDGINEAENKDGRFFGNDRLISLCKSAQYKDLPFEKHIDVLTDSIKSFTDGAVQSDDITALSVKINRRNTAKS